MSLGPCALFFQPSIMWASWRAGQRLSSKFSAWMSCLSSLIWSVRIEDGEAGLEPHQLGVAAHHLHADRVERAEPRHPLHGPADGCPDAVLHLARGLVGEGDGEDLARPRAPGGEDVGDARREHARLARARAGEDEEGALGGLDRLALLRVQALENSRAGGGRRRGRRGRARRCPAAFRARPRAPPRGGCRWRPATRRAASRRRGSGRPKSMRGSSVRGWSVMQRTDNERVAESHPRRQGP